MVIAYPDEGAWKRFHGFFKGMDEVVCTKAGGCRSTLGCLRVDFACSCAHCNTARCPS